MSQIVQRQVAVGYVAAMRDQGQDFLEHLCQSQVPVVPESPGVLLPGDSAPVVNHGSGMSFPGFAGFTHLALCSRRLPARRHAHAEKCADASCDLFH